MEVSVPKGPTLSREEMRARIAAAQGGDREARNALVEANLRLVASIVQRFRGSGADPDDLFQVGCFGLMKAIEKFDLRYDVAFSTYAVPLIIGEIRRYLRDDRPVHVGRGLQELARAAREARERLTQALGRSPTADEIARELGVPRDELVLALDADQAPASLDQPLGTGDERPVLLGEQLASPETDEPIDSLALAQILRTLDETERTVITLRYLRRLPQTRVAQILRCSQAHVSRLEKRIIERLRRLWL